MAATALRRRRLDYDVAGCWICARQCRCFLGSGRWIFSLVMGVEWAFFWVSVGSLGLGFLIEKYFVNVVIVL